MDPAQPVSVRPRVFAAAAITAALQAACLSLPSWVQAQTNPQAPSLAEIRVPRTAILSPAPHRLEGPARPGEYLGAVGPEAAWLGFETGEGEVWAHPLKIARDIRLSFSIPQYAEAIPGSQVATAVEVAPGHVQVTYSHEAFVVRQHVLAPRDLPGILILLEVDAVVELDIQVEFQPVLQYAWPGGFGGQYLFWDQGNRAFILSESLRGRNAVFGSPWAQEASAHPAHQLAEAPSVFVIPVDPERSRDELIPIGIVGGIASREEVLATYRELLERAATLPLEIAAWAVESALNTLAFQPEWRPDRAGPGVEWADFNDVLGWAKANLAEQRVCNPDLGCGFVAGWGPSGTSFRPGFGWFFGGDAAINTLAMDATGQWGDVAEALRFLARYQREDGKIPHEISQSAGRIPWFDEYPYAYYHADTTPYWMLALWQYWRASGDEELLRDLWPAFEKAYRWCLSVETDGDGIIENTTGGLGAIEVGGLGEGIHQDIYLAAVWIKAIQGTGEMARALGETLLATDAETLFLRARNTLNDRYWMPEEGYHAFGLLQGGGTNGNLTAWPATALAFGLLDQDEAEGTLWNLSRDAISSSWGARLLSTESELYDPLHYNNGMVWPFMTGFVAWGQYQYRRPWAGFPLLHALWTLHGDWSLGRHPENLSGAFYQTLDATVPHQFFASSMLVTPLARGLLGWDPDASRGRAVLAPQPYPAWPRFTARHLRVGESSLDITYVREAGRVEVELESWGPPVEMTYVQSIPLGATDICVDGNAEGGPGVQRRGRHEIQHEITFRLAEGSPVRLSFRWEGGLEVYPGFDPRLSPGVSSRGPRILDFTRDGEDWVLTVEGEGGAGGTVFLQGVDVEADGGSIEPRQGEPGVSVLMVEFPNEGPRVVRTLRLRPRRPSPDSGLPGS
ncbi:MAG: GH116 family glycosyl hydrolase [Gemmatimonadota bacterium]